VKSRISFDLFILLSLREGDQIGCGEGQVFPAVRDVALSASGESADVAPMIEAAESG
jgi:hypothetical protein